MHYEIGHPQADTTLADTPWADTHLRQTPSWTDTPGRHPLADTPWQTPPRHTPHLDGQ